MRYRALLVAALVVVGAGIPLATAASSPTPTDSAGQLAVQEDDSGNESTNGTAPGAQLAGVVNVQGAEVQGNLAERSFGLRIAAAKSNSSKAAVIANQSGELASRLAELRERKQTLIEAKQNGSISQARFRAEMAGLAADISTVNSLLNSTTGAAAELPAPVLAEHGVNATALLELRQAAGNLSGPQVAQIARNISGPPVNVSVGPPVNVSIGPSGNVSIGQGNGTVGVPQNGTVGGPENGSVGPPEEAGPGEEDDEQTTTTAASSDTFLPTGSTQSLVATFPPRFATA